MREELVLLENESPDHFIYRVYRFQEDTDSLTNDECGDICNKELNFSQDESAYRKVYQYFKRIWSAVSNELVSSERLDEIDKREDALFKTKVKTGDKLREYRKHLRDDARIENIKDVAIESAKIIAKTKPINILKKCINIQSDKVAVVQLSDWHFGNVVKNYWNDLDTAAIYKRVSQFAAEVIENCDTNGVKNIKVISQGDLINGLIHFGVRVANEEDIISQTQHVAEMVAQLMSIWCEHFDSVEYSSVLDNHSRVTPNKHDSIEKENFSRFIDWFLKARLSNVSNFKMFENEVDPNIGVIDIFKEKAFFVHGHLDRPSSMVQNLTLMTRIFPIAVFTAHMHHSMEDEIHGIDLIMSPSLSGTDEYSVSVRATGLARQKMTIYKNGDKVKRLCTYFIEF